MKYYGIILNRWLPKIKEYGGSGSHNQFRIVCKAKSRAEANRQAEAIGLGKNIFTSVNTSETGNKIELAAADKYGFTIRIEGNNYIDIKHVL